MATTPVNPQTLEVCDNENNSEVLEELPALLEDIPAEEQPGNTDADTVIIEESDGVPFINKEKISAENDKLNPDFAKLVDSVLK